MSGKQLFSNTQKRNKYIVKRKKQGIVNATIAKEVALSVRQIQNIYKTSQNQNQRKKIGRPKALQKGNKIRILNTLRKNPYLSCSKIQTSLGLKVSPRTINNYLQKCGWTYKKAKKIAKLSSSDSGLAFLTIDFRLLSR